MNRQLSEAEASLARLIDAVIADEVTEPDFNAAPAYLFLAFAISPKGRVWRAR